MPGRPAKQGFCLRLPPPPAQLALAKLRPRERAGLALLSLSELAAGRPGRSAFKLGFPSTAHTVALAASRCPFCIF